MTTPRPDRVRQIVRIAALAGWCGLVWYLSDQSDPSESVGFSLELPDWLYHGAEYLVGGWLARNALTAAVGGRRATFLAFAFCVLWALLDEWHQSFVPGRDPSGTDVAADAVGAALGITLHALVRRSVP